jgi:hypothetical protein
VSYTNSITETQVFTALRAWLLSIIPAGTEVVRGQGNRVPLPKGPFCVITPLFRTRLSTNIDTWRNTPMVDTLQIETDTRYDVQLDCYGDAASENAQLVMALWRDGFAYDTLAPQGVAPLYTSEPQQMNFTNDQDQYEDRWLVTLVMEINPIITVPQQFADTLVGGVFNVDATFPPGG